MNIIGAVKMISLVYFTYRAGGFDLLAESLFRQDKTDWELIVVDDYPDRDVSQELLRMGLPLAWYGQSKPKKYTDAKWGVANAMNTGFEHSKGDIILYVHDYSWLYSNALRRWEEVFKGDRKKLVVGVGDEFEYRGLFDVKDWTVFYPVFVSHSLLADGRFEFYHHWIPEEFEMFYSAYPREFLEATCGFDEKCDYDIASDYPTIVATAKRLGYKLEVDKRNVVNIVNHRQWDLGNRKMWNVVLK